MSILWWTRVPVPTPEMSTMLVHIGVVGKGTQGGTNIVVRFPMHRSNKKMHKSESIYDARVPTILISVLNRYIHYTWSPFDLFMVTISTTKQKIGLSDLNLYRIFDSSHLKIINFVIWSPL